MLSLFGGKMKDWNGKIPSSFPGKSLGSIKLEPIDDVPSLCRRIARVIDGLNPKILGIQEGPYSAKQLQVFVKKFLMDEYTVHFSNQRSQSICAIVHNSIANKVVALEETDDAVKMLSADMFYYPWGKFRVAERKEHRFARRPLILKFSPTAEKTLFIIVVHTKSKFSKLKKKEQWQKRDKEAILDAMDVRQKVSAEIARLRMVMDFLINTSAEPAAAVVLGDFNDGPFRELMEEEFLIHNILDELVGSFLKPSLYLKHAMDGEDLEGAFTVEFSDPLKEGALVKELIDHCLLSPGIWEGTSPFALKEGSCKVEHAIFEKHDASGTKRDRQLRPSDHRPVSMTLQF